MLPCPLCTPLPSYLITPVCSLPLVKSSFLVHLRLFLPATIVLFPVACLFVPLSSSKPGSSLPVLMSVYCDSSMNFLLSLKQTGQVVPTCQHAPMTAEQSACECRYGNDMKLERKESGSAQTNKKDKQGEAMCTNMQRDIHQHKHKN